MEKINNKKAREYDSPLLARLLAEITPQEHARTRSQMMMSARIADAIVAKGWSKGEFAKHIGQTPSTISKWLSGTHNFTTDTLTDIQGVLGIQLLCVEDVEPIETSYTMIKFEPLYINTNQQKQFLG